MSHVFHDSCLTNLDRGFQQGLCLPPYNPRPLPPAAAPPLRYDLTQQVKKQAGHYARINLPPRSDKPTLADCDRHVRSVRLSFTFSLGTGELSI